MDNPEVTNNYDSEPVRYCSRCYSLKIKYEESIDSECCADCGCLDIQEASIEDWERIYTRRYGKRFVVKTEDPTKTYLFRLSVEKLKQVVYDNKDWKALIKTMYPDFPSGYSKTDSVILFFDTLIKQNRLAELKLLLFKRLK